MCVYYGFEVDLTALDSLLQHRSDPSEDVLVLNSSPWPSGYSLRRVGRVDDDGILALVICDQVGVVVATAHPFQDLSSATWPIAI